MVLIPCSLWLSHLQKEHIKASGAHRGREPAFFSWDNSFLQATQDFTTITCFFCLKPSRRPFLCARAELQQKDEGIGELYSPAFLNHLPPSLRLELGPCSAQGLVSDPTLVPQAQPAARTVGGTARASFPSGNGGVEEALMNQDPKHSCKAAQCSVRFRVQHSLVLS